MSDLDCDALVFFGASGDLAYKKIFPSLQAMVKHGTLNVPVIGVAKSGWTLERLQARARDSVEKHGGVDPGAFGKLMELLHYIDGDYAEPATFQALRKALGDARRPAHYLAIPPLLFGAVVERLSQAGCAPLGSRVVVEKPFGRDLESARALNEILLGAFDENHVFRIDHYLGKRPVHNMLFFRFTNTLFESLWSRAHVESVSDHDGGGLRHPGARRVLRSDGDDPRDVVQNHLFQVLANLAMEPPARTDSESVRDEKVKVLKSIPPVGVNDVVRGQFRGYRDETGVAPNSQVETFVAMRLAIDSWRWQGVPFFIRSGKSLRATCTEIVARLRRPPSVFPAKPTPNYLRFRINPVNEVAIGLNVMHAQQKADAQTVELLAHRVPGFNERDAYERVLSDALAGDRTLFAREDYVEEAWRIVDPVIKAGTPLYQYESGTWGPEEVETIAPPGGWSNPVIVSA